MTKEHRVCGRCVHYSKFGVEDCFNSDYREFGNCHYPLPMGFEEYSIEQDGAGVCVDSNADNCKCYKEVVVFMCTNTQECLDAFDHLCMERLTKTE